MPQTARQIADDLRARITSGEFGAGARLPGEPALVQQYGVAKMTAGGALKLLIAEGIAYARPGSGTYVRDFQPIRRVANQLCRPTAEAPWPGSPTAWKQSSSA
ncbi:winged helix-turn-helix domain-containing protein [Streptomyces sp. NPDC088348]|uniref:winged helix-turn-helix domain-containing protein n=1 Tax=Streptomyces sp. NPDC088348 TaxID=3365853 RepID=UPI003823396B